MPRHIAIIMDGNGRWAKAHGKPRTAGHLAGAKNVRRITTECSRLGIEQLTLYAFSVENWERPKTEVTALMHLLAKYLQDERPTMMKNNIRFATIGSIEDLPASAQREIAKTKEITSKNTGMVLCLALSYGGRREIAEAAKKIAVEISDGKLRPEDVNQEMFGNYLYSSGMPDPDLLIRTAGEMRISNFLLWQVSYTEFYVTDVFWPDFDEAELRKAIDEYSRRERRFGRIK